jgi:hypothetical protein
MEIHSGRLHDGRSARLSSTLQKNVNYNVVTLQISLVVLYETKKITTFCLAQNGRDFFFHFVIHDVFAAAVSADCHLIMWHVR